jgi:hypothetical protein
MLRVSITSLTGGSHPYRNGAAVKDPIAAAQTGLATVFVENSSPAYPRTTAGQLDPSLLPGLRFVSSLKGTRDFSLSFPGTAVPGYRLSRPFGTPALPMQDDTGVG